MHPRSESVSAWAWNYSHILNHSPMFSALSGMDISIISVDRIVLGHTQLFVRVLARIHFIIHTQTRAHPQPSRFCAALGARKRADLRLLRGERGPGLLSSRGKAQSLEGKTLCGLRWFFVVVVLFFFFFPRTEVRSQTVSSLGKTAGTKARQRVTSFEPRSRNGSRVTGRAVSPDPSEQSPCLPGVREPGETTGRDLLRPAPRGSRSCVYFLVILGRFPCDYL